jgi:hypothetical protein
MSHVAEDHPAGQPLLPLEERVRMLESAVAALQDTHALEYRLAERLGQQMQAAVTSEAERLAETRLQAGSSAAEAVPQPVPQAVPLGMPFSLRAKFVDLPLLLVEICREAVAIFRMFFDLHYKVAWSTRLLTIILLPAILLSAWWAPLAHLPVVGEIVDKLVDLVLAFVMFKALSREARRYMESRH